MDETMDKDFNEHAITHSDVTLRLADIQKRCTQLLEETGDETAICLVLEDPNADPNDNNNPYDHS